MSNSSIARRMAEVAAALVDYDHLPALRTVSVSEDFGSDVNLYVQNGYTSTGRIAAHRAVAEWAAAFDVPITIDMSSFAALYAVVPLAGTDARISVSLNHNDAYDLGRLLGIPVTAGGQVEVSARQLLDVLLPVPAAETRPAADEDAVADAACVRQFHDTKGNQWRVHPDGLTEIWLDGWAASAVDLAWLTAQADVSEDAPEAVR